LDHADKQLVERMLRGDERAFDEFFESYAAAVYRFAASRLGRASEHTGELTQLTLIKALSKLETYRGDSGLFAWLCTFCRHELSAFYERRNRQAREVALVEQAEEVQEALVSSAGVHADDPEAALRRKQSVDRVHAALDGIPAPYGTVLEWKYIDGLSARDIATRLGSSVKAAESLLTRARVAFREHYSESSTAVRHGVLSSRKRG
jgi:RNA polymerase sigma-70 factor (ECF subfamily)